MVNFVRHNLCISIHAPRTGSDEGRTYTTVEDIRISIHAPRTGSDRKLVKRGCFRFDFNPRSPHGERLFACRHPFFGYAISIHAPRTGSDARR